MISYGYEAELCVEIRSVVGEIFVASTRFRDFLLQVGSSTEYYFSAAFFAAQYRFNFADSFALADALIVFFFVLDLLDPALARRKFAHRAL
jgi:hypothetical protein